jgi:hypothetical protein
MFHVKQSQVDAGELVLLSKAEEVLATLDGATVPRLK